MPNFGEGVEPGLSPHIPTITTTKMKIRSHHRSGRTNTHASMSRGRNRLRP